MTGVEHPYPRYFEPSDFVDAPRYPPRFPLPGAGGSNKQKEESWRTIQSR